MSRIPENVSDFAELRQRFAWDIPTRLNMAELVLGGERHKDDRPALIDGATGKTIRFGELDALSSRMANVMSGYGVGPGDRVGVLLSQRWEVAAFHLAAWKLGAISLPLFQLFADEALRYRLADSGASLVLTDAAGMAKLAEIRNDLPALDIVLNTDAQAGEASLVEAMSKASDRRQARATEADDPATLIYTSGTTGNPKGALLPHRVLSGHVPGVQLSHDLAPADGDRFWTPADWAWIGGLFDVLMPALYFGTPVIIQPAGKFDPEASVSLMQRYGVRNCFLPPTALRMMRQVLPAHSASIVGLRSIASGGERLGDDVLDWCRSAFGVTVNEFYGQTECNMVVSNCARLLTPRPGSMGVAVPGHEVAVVDDDAQPLSAGEVGDIAVRSPDPVMFLGYWRNPEAAKEKFKGDWLLTGDRGFRDDDGFLTFVGRDDDIINTSGYRVGPAEIETCLCAHHAVAQAAVIGVADAVRGERVRAYVVLDERYDASPDTTKMLQDFVKGELAAHEYPREIHYRAGLPLTATGKIRRAALRKEAGAERGTEDG